MTVTLSRPPALYGALNARQLTFSDVGRLFVPSEEFAALCRPANHVLLGPRGSGKTMLMKMLVRSALDEWRVRAGEAFIEPSFIGVYVPTDLLWARTLNQYWARAPLETWRGTLTKQLVQNVITMNILEALLETIEIHCEKEPSGAAAEVEIVKDLSQAWKLKVPSYSFYRLQQAIKLRVSTTSGWLERFAFEPNAEFIPPENRDALYVDPIRLVGFGLDVASEYLNIPPSARWALCFDELEIAPTWLREYVVSALRSTDQRLLFKLSAAPMQALAADELFPNASQQLHDYQVLKLWHAGIKDPRDFCKRLASRFIEWHTGQAIEPEAILGRSTFASADEDIDAAYEPKSDFWRRVRELSAYDPGLRRLMREKDINIRNLGHIDQKERDEVLRKLKPIVILRHEFLKPHPTKPEHAVRRSRKSTNIYTGAEAVYAVCDGNPRWLTGLLSDMLRDTEAQRVSRTRQARVIAEAASRFLALLSVMPESTQIVHGKPLSVRAVLETVGRHFEEQFLGPRVILDPKGTFIVDSAAGDELVELIRMAAAQGAVVYVDSENIDLNASPRGKRFRLSFLLAPAFRLPFRVYDHDPLSRCLGGRVRSELAEEVFEFEQAELFGKRKQS